ncbi:MAG: phage holin family protein [Patescibacteria group bacterium]
MKFLARAVLAFIANAFALIVIARYIPGIALPNDFKAVFFLALILTALNFILKPILRLILSPVIALTLGLGVILVNMIVLYALDILSPALTITGIPALAYAALILGFINFISHFFFR